MHSHSLTHTHTYPYVIDYLPRPRIGKGLVVHNGRWPLAFFVLFLYAQQNVGCHIWMDRVVCSPIDLGHSVLVPTWVNAENLEQCNKWVFRLNVFLCLKRLCNCYSKDFKSSKAMKVFEVLKLQGFLTLICPMKTCLPLTHPFQCSRIFILERIQSTSIVFSLFFGL